MLIGAIPWCARSTSAGYPGRFTFADFLSRYELLLTKKDLARAKATNKKFANVRRALTSSDLKFYVSLWQHVGPVKQVGLMTHPMTPTR